MSRVEAVVHTVARRAALPATLFGVAGLLLYGVIPWRCPVALVLRVPCPGCGLTRALRLALHGELVAATHMHPLWFLVAPALLVAAMVEMRGYLRDGRLGAAERAPGAKALTTGLVVLLVVVWVARFAGAFGGPAPI